MTRDERAGMPAINFEVVERSRESAIRRALADMARIVGRGKLVDLLGEVLEQKEETQ